MITEQGRQNYGATILVVDDKPANIKLLFDALQGTGYRTLAALDGESAVRQAELAAPDLILMDVMMPGIDGFEACRQLKALPATQHIPVIFMTALAETSAKVKGFKAGGVDYLTKPLQHDEVLARIDAHMSRHRLWADVATYSEMLLAIGAADSLEKAWTAVATLATGQQEIAGIALWLAKDQGLELRHTSGFRQGGPATWRRVDGDYRLVPFNEPLLGRVYRKKLQQENEGLRAEVSAPVMSGGIIGASTALRRVLDQVELVAPTEAAVLILGESGTGKELLAEKIHAASRRRAAPIIRVNCAAIPGELFESEFFGHVQGSFTGAVKDRAGRFELADGGTLFLDEVAEIPSELQGKLLRVLQEGSFERIGEEKSRSTDVRIVAATNRDLQQAVADGRFREDLYYRLSVFPLILPPLRERREDIPLLARHFAALTARKMGLSPPEINETMLAGYLAYDWPGNIRELHNEIERAMILARGGALTLSAPSRAGGGGAPAISPVDRLITEQEWQAIQRDNYLRALRQTAWRIDGPGGAAELLGLRPTTLRSRMKAMAITRPV